MASRSELRDAMRLYAVTDSAWLGERTLATCVEQAIRGGATFVQLREKHASTDALVEQGRDLLALCRAAGVPFVIDDDVEAAARLGADGVHVGQSDVACAEARATLGPDAIIGVSAQTVEQALAAQEADADYLGVGALFSTSTKTDAALVTKETLRQICSSVDIPVVAIGGLNAQTIATLAGTGVDGAAVVSALFAAKDVEAAARELRELLDEVI